ncbi:hypothetical protein T4C_688 [Trichinella pseudospiralis]|uniref:Uncharacterized protein n=1 Tax=Trichinella pseudospiralis TaxID=6337 RepID=A0A0V1GDE9_TRIPS|nr:hypothetical protein T4C_688 [Trichinella pseudospiralis]
MAPECSHCLWKAGVLSLDLGFCSESIDTHFVHF